MTRILRRSVSAGARPCPGRSSSGLAALRGAPPGQCLRSGSYMAAKRSGTKARSAQSECPRFQGNPGALLPTMRAAKWNQRMWLSSAAGPGHRVGCGWSPELPLWQCWPGRWWPPALGRTTPPLPRRRPQQRQFPAPARQRRGLRPSGGPRRQARAGRPATCRCPIPASRAPCGCGTRPPAAPPARLCTSAPPILAACSGWRSVPMASCWPAPPATAPCGCGTWPLAAPSARPYGSVPAQITGGW